jgi:hypothetical protein
MRRSHVVVAILSVVLFIVCIHDFSETSYLSGLNAQGIKKREVLERENDQLEQSLSYVITKRNTYEHNLNDLKLMIDSLTDPSINWSLDGMKRVAIDLKWYMDNKVNLTG